MALSLLLCLIPLASFDSSNQDGMVKGTTDLDAVVAQWLKREESVRTVKFAWTETKTWPKGSLLNPGLPPFANPEKLTIPAEDMTHQYTSTLSFEVDGLVFSSEMQIYNAVEKRFLFHRYTSASDGQNSVVSSIPQGSYSTGVVAPTPANVDLRTTALWPLLLAFRPLHPKMGLLHDLMNSRDNYVISKKRAAVGESSCVILEESPKLLATRQAQARAQPQGMQRSWWLDPRMDHTVVRFILTSGNRILTQIDIKYKTDPQYKFIPTSWSIVMNNPDGTLLESTTAAVTDAGINGGDVKKEDFKITYAPGTWVTDLKENQQYIVRADGSKRFIRKGESGKSYAELVASDSSGRISGYVWFWVFLGIVLVCTALAIYWWRARRIAAERRPSGSS
jgi:hypothetical protein